MKYEIINEKDAPAAPAPMTKGMRESSAILDQLKKGSVAAITPDDGQTVRGIKASMSRAAKRQGLKVSVYEVDGVVYVRPA